MSEIKKKSKSDNDSDYEPGKGNQGKGKRKTGEKDEKNGTVVRENSKSDDVEKFEFDADSSSKSSETEEKENRVKRKSHKRIQRHKKLDLGIKTLEQALKDGDSCGIWLTKFESALTMRGYDFEEGDEEDEKVLLLILVDNICRMHDFFIKVA